MGDPANDLRWIRALSGSRKLTDGDFGAGTRVERTARMLGRSMTYTTEVVSFSPGSHVGMKTVSTSTSEEFICAIWSS